MKITLISLDIVKITQHQLINHTTVSLSAAHAGCIRNLANKVMSHGIFLNNFEVYSFPDRRKKKFDHGTVCGYFESVKFV